MKAPNRNLFNGVIAIVSLVLMSSGSLAAQTPPTAQSQVMTTTTSDTEQAPKLPNDQLDSLVAPIALYSDPLLAQTLAASTYPLEIIQLQQWMDRNKGLKGKALADAVAKQPWDPSVQGLVEFPDVVQRMAGNVQWTTDLGNAFLAQQSDVMDAVQRMRAKAQGTGNLKTSAQQVVQTETVPSGIEEETCKVYIHWIFRRRENVLVKPFSVQRRVTKDQGRRLEVVGCSDASDHRIFRCHWRG